MFQGWEVLPAVIRLIVCMQVQRGGIGGGGENHMPLKRAEMCSSQTVSQLIPGFAFPL